VIHSDTINRATILPHHFRELPLDVLGLQHAYERAKYLHAARPVPPGSVGYRVFWVYRDNVQSIDLPAHANGEHLVIGRHTQCDVVLPADPTIALRHLLVRAVILPDGTVGTRIMDLRTTLAFHVDDGAPCRSIFAVGPIAIRLGAYAIVLLPVDSRSLPAQLPKPVVARAAVTPNASPMGPYRSPARPDHSIFRSSHITILPRMPHLQDLPPSEPRTRNGPACARILLDRGSDQASVDATESELDSGILIGRAEKCERGGLRSVLDISISRAHVLLLRENGVTTAFDLASTQGTFAYGRRVRSQRLAGTGSTLALGRTVRLHWMERVR
jgi:hypothetical protein